MLFNYQILILLIFRNLIIAENPLFNNHENIIRISSVLDTQLIFNVERVNELIDDENVKIVFWYKGITNLKLLISNSVSSIDPYGLPIDHRNQNQSRYSLVNQTILSIAQTSIGDEGLYTLKIKNKLNIFKQYHYHVVLFTQNLSLFISPPSYQQDHYCAEQSINISCSISLYADYSDMEEIRSSFSLIWYMILYNNDPDHYQLLPSTSKSYYTYTAYLYNYELNRNDHNQTVFCTLNEQKTFKQTMLLNVTLPNLLNIEYKTYLHGNYYFIRSFNSYSSIEINCEEFDGNPKPYYTLIWMLNGENRTLLNKTKYGRYFIENATWRHRGNYLCLAENYLNNHHPVHQSFRLNIWFNEHQLNFQPEMKFLTLEETFQSNKLIILTFLIILFLFSCLFFVLSCYYFCLQKK